jgi:hypothetical protein
LSHRDRFILTLDALLRGLNELARQLAGGILEISDELAPDLRVDSVSRLPRLLGDGIGEVRRTLRKEPTPCLRFILPDVSCQRHLELAFNYPGPKQLECLGVVVSVWG